MAVAAVAAPLALTVAALALKIRNVQNKAGNTSETLLPVSDLQIPFYGLCI
jgi:hypothetical protein